MKSLLIVLACTLVAVSAHLTERQQSMYLFHRDDCNQLANYNPDEIFNTIFKDRMIVGHHPFACWLDCLFYKLGFVDQRTNKLSFRNIRRFLLASKETPEHIHDSLDRCMKRIENRHYQECDSSLALTQCMFHGLNLHQAPQQEALPSLHYADNVFEEDLPAHSVIKPQDPEKPAA